jgi:hypothetical protein
MKNTKYKHGYWPKISYWQCKLNDAVWNMDLKGADSAHNKLNYFIGKQWELEYGVSDNVIAGVDFTETLSKFPTL